MFPKTTSSNAGSAVVNETWRRGAIRPEAVLEDDSEPLRVRAPGRTFDALRIDQDELFEKERSE